MGLEHFAEAEQLLARATSGEEMDVTVMSALLSAAQTHALLAQVKATADYTATAARMVDVLQTAAAAEAVRATQAGA